MEDVLNRAPVYLQLNQLLRSLVASAEFLPGQRFLTEREIAARFAVSRATANKALSNLVSEGMLEFRKGMGTYLRQHPISSDLGALVSFTDRAQVAGKRPETVVLSLTRTDDAPSDITDALAVPAQEPIWAIERLRLADRQPLILERRWVPLAAMPVVNAADLSSSIYQLWTGRMHLTISGCRQTISSVALTAGEAQHLGVPSGAAALQVHGIGYLADGRPLWVERTLYRGDGFVFSNVLGRVPGGNDAGIRSLIAATDPASPVQG
ncbi:MAG: GntR family transcriptional regulator [Planctomycetes bacterium]|nr:GntR family transcriptional regulator [Planctomycetota bacterium]